MYAICHLQFYFLCDDFPRSEATPSRRRLTHCLHLVTDNHKPSLSSSTAPAKARLKPSPGDDSYDLSFRDDGGQYAYQGTRSTDDSKYVLIFDPNREVLVLHKVDSVFDMNVTQTPTNNDPDSLRRKYPQLESHRTSTTKPTKSKAKDNSRKPSALRENTTSKKGKDLPMPPKNVKQPQQQPAPMPAKKQHATSDSEDDDSSDDGLLQIEEPGGPSIAHTSGRDFSPAFGTRRFSEFVQQNTEEEDDADGEDDDDAQSIEHFTLPSPVNRQMEASAGLSRSNDRSYDPPKQHFHQAEEVESDEDMDAEMEDVQQTTADYQDQDDPAVDEDDLEAEFMAAFEDEEGQQDQQESDVSEEE